MGRATDDFNRGSLGGDWTLFATNHFALSSNHVIANQDPCGDLYNAFTPTSGDMYAKATLVTHIQSGGIYLGVITRGSVASGGSGYIMASRGSLTVPRLYRMDSGSLTEIGNCSPSLADGDVIALYSAGSKHQVRWNGVIVITTTDSTIASGLSGIYGRSASSNYPILDDFEVGDLLPPTNLTLHCDASVTDRLFTTWDSGGAHSGVPADGDAVQVWDDEGDGIADVAMMYASGGTEPAYRSSTPLMLNACLDFDGSASRLTSYNQNGSSNPPIGSFITASAYTVLIAAYPEAITTTATNSYDNAVLLADGNTHYFGLFTKSVGGAPKILLFNWDGTEDVVSLDLPVGQTSVIMARHEGGNLYLSVNGGSESSVASGNTESLTYPLTVGGHVQLFNGRIGEFAIWNAALTGATLSAALNYFTSKWLAAPSGFPNRLKGYGPDRNGPYTALRM